MPNSRRSVPSTRTSQRGLFPVPEVRLLPGREFPIDEAARQAFRRRWRDRIEGDPSRSSVYKDVGNGIAPAGIEYYLPLFFDETATLFDYLPPDRPARAARPDRGRDAALLDRDQRAPPLPRARLGAPDPATGCAVPRCRSVLRDGATPWPLRAGRALLPRSTDTPYAPLPPLAVERRAEDPVARLRRFAEDYDGRILIVADSAGRRETIGQMLAEFGIPFGDSADFADFAAGPARIGARRCAAA